MSVVFFSFTSFVFSFTGCDNVEVEGVTRPSLHTSGLLDSSLFREYFCTKPKYTIWNTSC